MTTPKVTMLSHDGCSPHGAQIGNANTGNPHGPDRYVIAPRWYNGEKVGNKLARIIGATGEAFLVEFTSDEHRAAAFAYELCHIEA